jgi:hypothetical protein
MLHPNERSVYLEQLRPPDDYILDRAIATTFSLDLLSLLMAPLSMVLYDEQGREDLLRDPIAVLEALRQTTDRFAVFCQQSRISVPQQNTRLYSLLEKLVVEVQPPRPHGVFHPKLWLMRFLPTDSTQPAYYRLLCLSKNLTFDRSWDTVLMMEGQLTNRVRGFTKNRPLADFLSRLIDFAKSELSSRIRDDIELLAGEVLRVRWEPPADFEDDIEFLPIGIDGYGTGPELQGYDRVLVVSPFVSNSVLSPLTGHGRDDVLISRTESLDELPDAAIDAWKENGQVLCMNESAERPDDSEDDLDSISASDFSGLHAKLFICEEGKWAHLYTGSANATSAAFLGANVEFLVGLTSTKRKAGVEAFLGNPEHDQAIRNMLQPYRRDVQPVSEEERVRRQLEKDLEDARVELTATTMDLQALPDSDGTYTVGLVAHKPVRLQQHLQGRCRLLSLQEVDARDVSPLFSPEAVAFQRVPVTLLTSFVVFHLLARRDNQRVGLSFVRNVPIRGLPEERDQRILQEIISDRSRFVRYLLFILAGEAAEQLIPTTRGMRGGGSAAAPHLSLPLFEELVRAFSRQSEKIQRIAKLVDDLRAAGQADELLPEGFEEIWQAFEKRSSDEVSA